VKKNIILIRHAESQSNAGFPTKNSHSTPLSSKGKVQAKTLAKNFKVVPQLIVVSSYLRTQETAQPLISKFKEAKTEVWDMVHEFTYLNREKYTNTTQDDRKEFALAYWNKKDPFYQDGPLEDSFFNLLKRAEKFIKEINKRKENTIVIFSHGEFLRSLRLIAGLNKKIDALTKKELIQLMVEFREVHKKFPVENAAIFTWEELTQII
jgi:broad specificity phosphatase PhoE